MPLAHNHAGFEVLSRARPVYKTFEGDITGANTGFLIDNEGYLLRYKTMQNYLYHHWADSTLILGLFLTVLLLAFLPSTPWYLFLIWLQFPVYLFHEFEEHVFPGKFRQFINREVFHSPVDDAPLTIPAVFWINILAIWILFPLGAILAQDVSPEYGALLPIFGLFNATLHILMLIIKRKYNPGLVVSIVLNYPTGIYTLYVLAQAGFLNALNATLAFVVTFLAHVLIVGGVVKNRKRHKQLALG